MRVLIVSKALVVASYRSKLRELSQLGIDVTAVVPNSWREEGREIQFEPASDAGYRVIRTKLAWNGHFHLHYYPALARILDQSQPDILHMDEEPYNLATFLAFRLAGARSVSALFFTWQNISRRYPPPFRQMEKRVYDQSAYGLAGNEEALEVLRAKGYSGPAAVIPQFGVDTTVFHPAKPAGGPFTVGFLGRLVPEKGVGDLLAAFAALPAPARLIVAGDGPLSSHVDGVSREWRRQGRFERHARVPSADVPDLLRRLNVLVVPSRTTRKWREQYGRVLIEAMACGVTVVGSSSGEIPNVIGDSGVIFPEGDASALARTLRELWNEPRRSATLSGKGRERAETRFSQRRVAELTAEVYRRIMEGAPDPVR